MSTDPKKDTYKHVKNKLTIKGHKKESVFPVCFVKLITTMLCYNLQTIKVVNILITAHFVIAIPQSVISVTNFPKLDKPKTNAILISKRTIIKSTLINRR